MPRSSQPQRGYGPDRNIGTLQGTYAGAIGRGLFPERSSAVAKYRGLSYLSNSRVRSRSLIGRRSNSLKSSIIVKLVYLVMRSTTFKSSSSFRISKSALPISPLGRFRESRTVFIPAAFAPSISSFAPSPMNTQCSG